MNEYYYDNGAPIKCPCCEGDWFYDKIRVEMDYYTMEYEIFCVWCHESLAYWAYGCFMPDYYNYYNIDTQCK